MFEILASQKLALILLNIMLAGMAVGFVYTVVMAIIRDIISKIGR